MNRFSQLNDHTLPHGKTDVLLTDIPVCVFSQLNAKSAPSLGQTQKDAFAEGAFSQLNAWACWGSRAQSVRHRSDFRGLKRRTYLHKAYEPRTTRGSAHLEPGFWRNRMT